MKPRSKLFLIVSAILIGVGLLVCLAGYIIAKCSGEQLFAQSLEGGRGYVYEFKDSKIDILKLKVKDADINIIGGAEKSYIEIINFNESLYTFESTASMVSFRQSPDISSVSSFWESGFSFKGLRYFLNPGTGRGNKIINVYLDTEQYIKVFDITAEGGTVTLSHIETASDYQLKPGGGKLTLENITTVETVNITSSDKTNPEIILDALSANSVNITAVKAKLTATELSSHSCCISLSEGSADIEISPDTSEDIDIDIATKGRLTVNGESYTDFYKYPDPADTDADTDNTDGEEKKRDSISINTSLSASDATVNITLPSAEKAGENDNNTQDH